MKKQGKGFIAGFISALLILGFVVPAFAAYQKQATLNYDDIKLMVNGWDITPKDATGSRVEPFTIDGTTYLPVRAISEALWVDVEWEQATKTVQLRNKKGFATIFALSAGVYTAGVDVPTGVYTPIAKAGTGQLYIHNRAKTSLKVNELLSARGLYNYPPGVNALFLADGDKIGITDDLVVSFVPAM